MNFDDSGKQEHTCWQDTDVTINAYHASFFFNFLKDKNLFQLGENVNAK